MAASASNRRPSAIDALGEGFAHMREKLFPFSFMGWITLGLVSLLESCGSGSGSTGVQNRIGNRGSFDDPITLLEEGFGWIAAHMILFVGILMVVMVVSLLFMWIRSRTIFVYIDDVASGRFDLIRPWGEHGAHADSFFVVSLVVQGASFILSVLIFGLGGFFVLWAKTNGWTNGALALAVIPIAFVFVLSLLVAAVLDMALRDFVAPLQIARNEGAQAAGGIFLSMLAQTPGLFIGYALVKVVFKIVVTIVVVVGSCLTCCIGALPLVNQTLFQPIYYAERAWSLKLLAQMGEDIFPKEPAGALTRRPAPESAWTGPDDQSPTSLEPPQTS